MFSGFVSQNTLCGRSLPVSRLSIKINVLCMYLSMVLSCVVFGDSVLSSNDLDYKQLCTHATIHSVLFP